MGKAVAYIVGGVVVTLIIVVISLVVSSIKRLNSDEGKL